MLRIYVLLFVVVILHTEILVIAETMLILEKGFHHKNKKGFELILKNLKWRYEYGSEKNIADYDIIFSPSHPVDTSKYPSKKFIFGPHFSIFPNELLTNINNVHNNSIYIFPSEWTTKLWRNKGAEQYLPLKVFSFPVNTDKFNSVKERHTKKKIFIYYKRRNLKDLQYITNFLTEKGLEYRVFDYITRYSEENYLNYLLESQYGIILDAHESQGFALEEAMSCNVPLLVWNTKSMAQEEGSHYDDIPCTTIPYWDKRCGEYFYEREDFKKKFHEFTNKLETYQPRQFVLENLSVESSATQLLSLIKSIKVKSMEEKSKYVG